MRSIRDSVSQLFIIGGLVALIGPLHAQATTISAQSFNSVSADDLVVMLQAIEEATPLSAESFPPCGTFWSAQHPDDWPPLPGNFNNLPVWDLGDGVYLLDDRDVDYEQSQNESSMMAMDLPAPGDGGDDGTNSFTFNESSFMSPDYGTNLWIAQVGITSGNLVGIATNSAGDVPYEIQSCENLVGGWNSEGAMVYGSETTNWTPISIVMNNRTNLFIRIKSWADSTDSGIPDWWWLQYFGTIGGDPYGNPAGDGWNNLQKFQKRMNPNLFYTPPSPQGVTVNFNSLNGAASITWQPSPGPVTGYIVKTPNGNFTNSVNTHSFVDTNLPSADPNYYWENGSTIFGNYSVQAVYGSNYSDWTGEVPLEPDVSGFFPATINLIPGPQGSAYLAASVLPPGTIALRLSHYDITAEQTYHNFSHDGSNDIPVTASAGGLYLIPSSLLRMTNGYYGSLYKWWVQTVNTNGSLSVAHSFFAPNGNSGDYYSYSFGLEDRYDTTSWLVPPYFDGRQQLKQNLIFLLRAATKDSLFDFADLISGGAWNFTNPSNYAYTGFYEWNQFGFDVLWPFWANASYRNFVFSSSDIDSNGRLNTGAAGNYSSSGIPLKLNEPAKYQFQVPATSGTTISALLATNSTRWLGSYAFDSADSYLWKIGATNYGNAYGLFSNIRNWFGLPFLSVNISGTNGTSTLNAGNTTTTGKYFYPETAQPQFQTVEYDFWNTSWGDWSSVPGSPGFTTTNHGDLLVTSVGNATFEVAGYAKLAVQNGYSGVYGYLAQYFDTAYKINTNGIVTTNTTGILSPYGQFFATEPGPAALVTMSDIDTGARGTCTVYCASMQLDKNNDGIMDLSFSGPDATSQASPEVVWINNGLIIPGTSGNLDHGVRVFTNSVQNFYYGQITCQRDLENFFRLWICGLPSLPASQGYTVTLSCNAISGSPAINLYAAETNGGTLYLTFTNAAQSLVGEMTLGTISSDNTYIFPNNFFDGSNKYFLFEGVGIGEGQFVLTISQNGNTIAQASAFIDLHDIKDLYEQAHITNVTNTWPEMVQQSMTSGFRVDHYSQPNPAETRQLAVFVHGWRMTPFDYQDFSDTMFKRLYWQGFQGRFASLRWPTRSAETDSNGLDYLTFNRSEHIAFASGTGAAAYFGDLRNRYTNYTISVCAHSQGNILMMEALKELTAANQRPLDNYVMMQAAVPAHCYDTTVPYYHDFTNEEQVVPTPNTYANYAAGITNALRGGKIINFFNTNDYALVSASTNITVMGVSVPVNISWIANQEIAKPLVPFGYSYNPTTSTAHLTNTSYGVTGRAVTDPFELMPFVARPRSLAVGSIGGVGGNVNGGNLDLFSLGFREKSYDHSGEFYRNIQDSVVQQFYIHLNSALIQGQP